jgi:prepilin-type N-terminal cleavage/methylation domain-containing protein
MKTRSGFSLIEALVALAIAAMCLLALLALQRQLTRAEHRYEQALTGVALQRDALALLRDINPTERPTGQLPLGQGRRLSWTAQPLTGTHSNTAYEGGQGDYDLRLYRLRVRLLAADGTELNSFDLDRVGWRRRIVTP